MIVDEAHAALPELARDQYWDELDIQLPYTLATHQTRRDPYTATADNIQSVYETADHDVIRNVRRILVRGVNAPMPPEATKILKI